MRVHDVPPFVDIATPPLVMPANKVVPYIIKSEPACPGRGAAAVQLSPPFVDLYTLAVYAMIAYTFEPDPVMAWRFGKKGIPVLASAKVLPPSVERYAPEIPAA